jgi:hypothetical protein
VAPSTLGLVLALSLCACRASGCTKGSSRSVELADDGGVPVDVDGKSAATIDRTLLERVPPDFAEDDRRGWRLRSLLAPGTLGDGATVEVEDGLGQRVMLARPSDFAAGRQPMVAVNRAGELRMAVSGVGGEEVFASFHGRGGNRGRAGEPGRVRQVRRVWIETGAAH